MELQEYVTNKEKGGEGRGVPEGFSPSQIHPATESRRSIETAEERAYYEKKEQKRLAR